MKKPKDWKITGWLKEKAPDLLGDVLEITGDVTGIEALERIGNKISGSENLSESDKAYALKLIEQDMKEQEEVTKRWESDNQNGAFISKIARPVVLLFSWLLMTSIVVMDASGVVFNENVLTVFEWCFLTVNGAYFGARTVEKFRGANMSFLKKGR